MGQIEYSMNYMNKSFIFNVRNYDLVSPKQISYKDISLNNYHLYFILSRPEPFFTSIKEDKELKQIKTVIKTGDEEYDCALDVSKYDDYKLELNERHRFFKIIDANDIEKEICVDAVEVYKNMAEHQNYKIEYIGMSYGEGGERTSDTRLASHSTLQKILADNHDSGEYSMINIMLIDTSEILVNILGVEDSDKIKYDEISGDTLPDERKVYISLQEAFLISYFKPKYNIEYKNINITKDVCKSYQSFIEKGYDSFLFKYCSQNNYKNYEDKNFSRKYILSTNENSIEIVDGFSEEIVVLFKELESDFPQLKKQ